MTSNQGSGSGDGKRLPRGRIIDVPPGSRTVDVASQGETAAFMQKLREIVESQERQDHPDFEGAIRTYLAKVPLEQRKRLARGIMASLPGPRPDAKPRNK